MTDPTLCRIDLRAGEDTARECVEDLIDSGALVPVEPQECRLVQSKPVTLESGESFYEIRLVSGKPADSLTMHDKVWLIGDTDGS